MNVQQLKLEEHISVKNYFTIKLLLNSKNVPQLQINEYEKKNLTEEMLQLALLVRSRGRSVIIS